MTEGNFRGSLKRACDKVGLTDGYHVHSIRKSTRTLLGAKKYHDLGEYLLGHATGMDKHYVRLDVEQAAEIYREAEKHISITDMLIRIESEKDVRIQQTQNEIKLLRDEVARLRDPKLWLEELRKSIQEDMKKGNTPAQKYIDSILKQ
jgi:hypothetical protein